ncbi:MAG: tryptophan synthase subunit alpha, partial [Chlamydiae bacterium]|nr:tryptophan synthase subunit alpha [Chlamydiota bacterium]
LFTYYNPIRSNLKEFLTSFKEAGGDGILIVDLPLEEAGEVRFFCKELSLDPIFVIAPTTSLERIRAIGKAASGFLYYACRKGTTGIRLGLPSDLQEKIEMIRSVSNLPIAVGFGISTRKAAQEILKIADAFVIGSYFVEEPKRVYDFRMC